MKNGHILVALLSSLVNIAIAQDYGLSDGRNQEDCNECQAKIKRKPKEVSFGIQFEEGKIYFLTNNEGWLNVLLSEPTDGITVDIVSKDQFECGKTEIPGNKWPMGYLIKPVYLPELKSRIEKTPSGGIRILLQGIPAELKGKEIEGNLAILRKNKVCFKINFENVGRSLWNLLDMGLYTDSLINQQSINSGSSQSLQNFFYDRLIKIIVPFAKGKVSSICNWFE